MGGWWTDGRTYGWMDVGRSVDGRTDGRMRGWMHGWMDDACVCARASARACVVCGADHQQVRAQCGVGVCRCGRVLCHTPPPPPPPPPPPAHRQDNTRERACTHAHEGGGGAKNARGWAATATMRLQRQCRRVWQLALTQQRGLRRHAGTGRCREVIWGTWDKPKRREGRQQPPGARIRRGA